MKRQEKKGSKKSRSRRREKDKVNVRRRVRRVARRMLKTGQPLTPAARAEHTDPRTVRGYLGASELKRLIRKAKKRPSKFSRRRRRMLVPTTLGTTAITVRGSKQASLLGRYMSAVGYYLRTGGTKALAEFKGASIGGHGFITDPETLNILAEAGSLQLERIYALPESSS